MAMQEEAPSSTHSAKVVGNAFVEQYYRILHHSPELVFRFYNDTSSLSRPDTNGIMATVTTMKEINDKILSLKYEEFNAEIETADAQESYESGVIVLVTGCLTGKDNVKRKFTQTFFLAPQDKGYFVLNDVFRFVGEHESLPNNSILVNGVNEDALPVALTPEPVESTQATDHLTVDPADSFEEEDLNNGAEVCDPSDKDEGSVIDEEIVEPPTDSFQNEIIANADAAPAATEDGPKKSYASIVKVMKGNTVSTPVYVPTSNVRAARANPEQQSLNSAKPTSKPETLAPTGGNPEANVVHEEAEGYSIYVRNLPLNATETHLDEAFKGFGAIKHGGIQVRSNKQGFCFGFVEFETMSSMQSALEASPIKIGDRDAIVEEKRTNTRVSSGGRGRYSGRSGFRSDSFRSRSNFGSGRGYGRNEFRNQGEFSGRPKGSIGRSGEDYQRVNQNGSRRGGRQGQGGGKGGSIPT